jgi:phage terminase small subunit
MPLIVGGRERPDPPPYMTNNMLECWNYIVEDLLKADMLDHADAGVVEAAAVFWGRARDSRMLNKMEMEKSRRNNGLTERTPQGRVENRLIQIERNSWKEFRALADVLPLSPWGRARLGMKMKAGGQSIEDDIGPPPRLRAMVGGAEEE